MKLALVLFSLGFIGILSLLSMEFPLPQEAKTVLSQKYTPGQIKGLILISPIILLAGSVIIGTALYEKVKLKLPVIEHLLFGKKFTGLYPLLLVALGGGLFSGLLITVNHLLFQPYFSDNYLQLKDSLDLSPWVRFLYGGITEEILLRFGLMTFLIWLLSVIIRSKSPVIYWIAICISAIAFAFGHLPILYTYFADPSSALLTYILVANTGAGMVYGWLYWQKGLETAIIAHMITHLILLIANL